MKNIALVKFRKDRGLSQVEAAALVPVSRETWIRWENGKTIPHVDQLRRVAEITDGAVRPPDWYTEAAQ